MAPQTESKMENLKKKIFYDELNEEAIYFLSDVEENTLKSIPEVEWYAVKNVLTNFGYTIIEIKDNGN